MKTCRPFVQVLAAGLRLLSPHDDVVPLGALLALAPRCVGPRLGGRDREARDRAAARREAQLRIACRDCRSASPCSATSPHLRVVSRDHSRALMRRSTRRRALMRNVEAAHALALTARGRARYVRSRDGWRSSTRSKWSGSRSTRRSSRRWSPSPPRSTDARAYRPVARVGDGATSAICGVAGGRRRAGRVSTRRSRTSSCRTTRATSTSSPSWRRCPSSSSAGSRSRSSRDIPVFGWALRRAGHIIIDRIEPRAGASRRCAPRRRQMDTGISVMIFPEGTRAGHDHELLPLKKGGFVLAHRDRYADRARSPCAAAERSCRATTGASTSGDDRGRRRRADPGRRARTATTLAGRGARRDARRSCRAAEPAACAVRRRRR